MDERIAGFDWDDCNREKCEKPGLSIAEIEGLLARPISARYMHAREITRYEQEENPDLPDR